MKIVKKSPNPAHFSSGKNLNENTNIKVPKGTGMTILKPNWHCQNRMIVLHFDTYKIKLLNIPPLNNNRPGMDNCWQQHELLRASEVKTGADDD